jgi:hypothetical protein
MAQMERQILAVAVVQRIVEQMMELVELAVMAVQELLLSDTQMLLQI